MINFPDAPTLNQIHTSAGTFGTLSAAAGPATADLTLANPHCTLVAQEA